ncbi:MAG TPA: S8 family serine peptidase [Myxococcota bacterium]|nr:S8 family serine peptidase [Myxococcota bacterium]
MLISIVNHSAGILDAKLQAAIRAINRQLREDFEPYWGRGGRLRLEGRSAKAPVPEHASDIRGEAVIYLCDCPEDSEDALGYHELNHRGIPYGFVFTELSKSLDEPWSVTLSHEVLELVLDPEANLLAKGPHPEDPTREVFHWYEACDAVQTQTYAIDGVRVSNFVLPLYFTNGDEDGSRNDFLGARQRGPMLASFGVAEGGYIGYFDPEAGDDRFYEPSERARKRNAIKRRAGLARRGVRYQRNAAPLAPLADVVGAAAQPPRLESIAVRLARGRASERAAQALANRVLGSGWKAVAVAGAAGDFDLVPRAAVDARSAWELSDRLRAAAGVQRAEPLFEAQLPDDEGRQEIIAARLGRLLRASKPALLASAPANSEWSIEFVRADAAWKLLDARGIEYGEGIRIAHPDTGYTLHPELPLGQIDQEADHDFVDDDESAVDPLADGALLNPGHGTGTSSVIVSPRGAEGVGYERHVTGIAPAARLVPLRVSKSVVQVSQRNLRDAIQHAVASDCHVISISLGGLPSESLHDAVQRAVAKGIIVLAAAGNYVRLVVWPARYREVVAVAACNERGEPWSGSSRGDEVDVTGPGQNVYRAYWERGPNGLTTQPRVGPSDGTSYAVATVAGVAALWLSYHGRENLLVRYPGAALPEVFASLLQSTCRTDLSLPEGFGSGAVDAERLLRAPLPGAAALAAARKRRARTRPLDPVDRLATLFPRVEPSAARAGLQELLGSAPRAQIDRVHDELVFHLTLDPSLHARVESTLAMSAGGPPARAKRRKRAAVPGPGAAQVRASHARMERARAAIAASGASRALRDCLWRDER